MHTKRVRLLLIAEFSVDANNQIASAQLQLDAFREATSPSVEYGITFWQARPEDLGLVLTPDGTLRVK